MATKKRDDPAEGLEAEISALEQALRRTPADKQDALLDKLDALVERLDAMLPERERRERADDPPGTIYNAGKLTARKKVWRWSDLKKMPKRTFTPNESILLTWNGLRVQVAADEEVTLPEVFYGIYQDHKQLTRFAQEHAKFLFDRKAVATHPDMLNPASMAVRGAGIGSFLPGAGWRDGSEAPENPTEGGAGGEAA